MARNDEFFLNRWVKYYGAEFGEENLYIFLDGLDQKIPENIGRANIKLCEHIDGKVLVADKKRITFLNEQAKKLFEKYDLIVGGDVDEFLVVEPNCGQSLHEYLSSISIKNLVSGLGIDIGQNLKTEDTISEDLPLLCQRSFGMIYPRYTKASVIVKPLRWGSGFHRVKGKNFKIDKNLFLFHFGSFDYNRLKNKLKDNEKLKYGWERHLKKRTKTIWAITFKKAQNWEKFTKFGRIMQTIFRPIYALNKPSMFGWKPVVKIPERFKDIV
jgi:hypothetical protein